ncbi:MAG: glycoside hydrolase family 88 protein [Bacteroidota bacterium]|nr:glycoside hydrolase family 88 protein [Bacteroidota bacterium]
MKITFCFSLFILLSFASTAQNANDYNKAMAKTVMNTWKDSVTYGNGKPAKWSYDQGVILKGIEGLWKFTGNGDYFKYMQKSMDHFVDDEGNIRTYKFDNYTLDNILCGRILLTLYKVTGKKKYYKAASILREQLRQQPRIDEGGFWHKKIYPDQMWLDGLYMAEPFYAEWAATFHEDSDFNDIARQFIIMEQHARDPKTGLLYHGYDASKKEAWANKTTGLSANFWARAMGWYGMGLVDALPYFPKGHPKRKALIAVLNRFAAAVSKAQDPNSGLWWDVLNFPHRKGNYEEASASCMFVYALAKGVRLGYLPSSYLAVAKKGYAGIIKKFITNDDGQMNFKGTVSVSGLGGHPYRDGSFNYYINEKVVTNDPKGIGAFLLASDEMELLPTLFVGKGKTVTLDYYFNHETKKDITGKTVQWHYVWGENDNGGYSMFGNIFHKYGVATKTLKTASTLQNLKNTSIYIIVDPDNEKESAHPNYIMDKDISAIYTWVKSGGVLLLFSNDSANVEFTHFNQLASKFGIHFNFDCNNKETGRNFDMAQLQVNNNNTIFKNVKKVYIKEYSSLSLNLPAFPVLKQGNLNVAAVAKIGKGAVFAVGDPWFYNEYTDGRKIPPDFQNYQAAEGLVKWAIGQTK